MVRVLLLLLFIAVCANAQVSGANPLSVLSAL
jgi:hypothetical protein